MKFWYLSVGFLIITILLSDALKAQASSPLICNPKEISKEEFNKMTKILLAYTSISKGLKEISLDGNCLMYISNNAGFLLGIVFHLDSNYTIKRAYFTKFGNDLNGEQPVVALRKKQLKEFESLKIDNGNLGHFISCSINSLHEDREILIFLKETEINSGLYLKGNPIFPIDPNAKGLIAFREKIQHLRIPKKLYYIK